MSNETKALAIIPRSLDEVTTLAEILAKSTLMPEALKGKVPDVVMQILAGQELGMPPMASIRGIHVFQGKPMLAADTMVALVRGSGLCEYFVRIEATATSVTYETKRNGDPIPQRCTWTMEMAKIAGLHLKDNWRGYARAMLASRAKAELARDVFPDILAGCYDPDEIQVPTATLAPIDRNLDATDAEIVDPVADALANIAAAETSEALRSLAKSLSKLAEPGKSTAKAAYKERMTLLEVPAPHTNGVTEIAAP